MAAVLVRGAGDRGLCAGGDIVAIYRDMLDGGDATADFWAEEYRLNLLISEYPKPYVAFMDGLVLGGGVGISAHGSVRIVTERTRIGHAGDHHRFRARRRRHPAALPLAGGVRHPCGPHRRAPERRRRPVPGARGPLRAVRKPACTGGGAGERDRRTPPSHASPRRPRASVLAAQQEWIDACYSERRRRRDPAAAAGLGGRGRGSGRRRRHDRGQVADRREGGAGIPAPGQGT